MLSIRTILHPTDFSANAAHAYQVARALARDFRTRLFVVHVGAAPVIRPVQGGAPGEPEEYQEELSAKLFQLRTENPGIEVETRLALGVDPATEILRLAREIACDLIVMGTHGRTGLGRLLMGSVAEEVVRKAPCSVLTVKTPLAEIPSA